MTGADSRAAPRAPRPGQSRRRTGGEHRGRGGVVKGGDPRALRTSGTAVAAAATPGGSGGLPADVGALVATLGNPSSAADAVAVELAGARARHRRDGDLQPARNRRRRARCRARCTTDQARPSARRAAGRHPGRRRRREPVHAAARRHGGHPALRTSTVPAKPRWLLVIPDAISPLEQLDRPLLTPARHRAALRRRQGARRSPHEDLLGRARRQPEAPAADQAPQAAQEAPRPGRVPRRGGETSPGGRRAPEGPADRGPVQGARRDHEREAGGPARGGVGRARAERGAVPTGRRTPWRGCTRWPRRSGTTLGGSRRSSVVEPAGERLVTE